jgi:hypothetical protein
MDTLLSEFGKRAKHGNSRPMLMNQFLNPLPYYPILAARHGKTIQSISGPDWPVPQRVRKRESRKGSLNITGLNRKWHAAIGDFLAKIPK